MTLIELKAKFNSARTGTDINQIFFDWNDILNKEINKSYPIIFWNIDFVTGIKSNITSETEVSDELEIQVFCIKDYDPEDDKLADFDRVTADLNEYLISLETDNYIKVQTRDVPYELWSPGTLSVDREIGVSYTITLELYC